MSRFPPPWCFRAPVGHVHVTAPGSQPLEHIVGHGACAWSRSHTHVPQVALGTSGEGQAGGERGISTKAEEVQGGGESGEEAARALVDGADVKELPAVGASGRLLRLRVRGRFASCSLALALALALAPALSRVLPFSDTHSRSRARARAQQARGSACP